MDWEVCLLRAFPAGNHERTESQGVLCSRGEETKLEVLVLGIASDMTRVEFEKICEPDGLHCLAQEGIRRK